MTDSIQLTIASTLDDLSGILDLQVRNLPSALTPHTMASQGFVTVRHDASVLRRMNEETPSIVAKAGGRVVGDALVMPRRFADDVPILRPLFEMLDTLSWQGEPLRSPRLRGDPGHRPCADHAPPTFSLCEECAMALLYGVLRGRPDRFKREDDTSSPHLQIRVLEDGGQPWRIAVNVQSNTGSHVAFWVVDPLVGHPALAALSGRPQGFTTLAANASQALDYVKAPLFDVALGRVLPPSGAASADDLQDLLSLFLEQCKVAGGEIFAFGAKFTQNLHKPIDIEFGNTDGLHGIHDIHMNQGNVGQHAGDNGVFHDGGLILKFPDRFMGLFLAFQSQRVPTDAAGAAAPGALTIGQILSGAPAQPTPLVSTIYIERALINPAGADAGLEAVVLGNLATTTQTLSHWRLLDKNGRATSIDATLPPGASLVVPLDGAGVQLGNNGGNLMLQDEAQAQVDVVTYTAEDASPDDRYLRFRR